MNLSKFIEFIEITSFQDYFKTWISIHNLYVFDLKKIEPTFLGMNAVSELLGLFPRSHLLEKPNNEIVGVFKLFLLPKIKIFYRIKIVTKTKKSLFEKNMVLLKYQLKVIFGVKMNEETPEIFKKEKGFIENCVRIVFCDLFGAFYVESKRLLDNKLETLKEEDEAMWETTKLK